MNSDHFITIYNRTATLTRESSHSISNLTIYRVVLLDSPLSLIGSLAFLAENECLTLLILELVVLALSHTERVAVNIQHLLLIHIDHAVRATWGNAHALAIRLRFLDPPL